MNLDQWLDGIKFDERGLVPVVMQRVGGPALTLAYANREALQLTRDTGLAHFYSRSRAALWKKGETSGYTQHVRRMVRDCDQDAVLYEVDAGAPACHTGEAVCFHDAPVELAGGPAPADLRFLQELYDLIERRKREMPLGSYTTRLFREGMAKIAQKVGEEGVEVSVAALAQTADRVVDESADLLYHLLVLWAAAGVTPGDVMARLAARHAGTG